MAHINLDRICNVFDSYLRPDKSCRRPASKAMYALKLIVVTGPNFGMCKDKHSEQKKENEISYYECWEGGLNVMCE